MDASARINASRRRAFLAALGLCVAFLGGAQERNPFDLTPRLDLPPAQEAPMAVADTGNPFDLIAPSVVAAARPAGTKAVPPAVARPQPSANVEAILQRIKLVAVLGSLLLFTILLTLLRSFFGYAYKAFLNDNFLSQLQRKSEGRGALPYYLFYGWALLNVGFFFFLLNRYYGVSTGLSGWLELAACIVLAVGLFLAKHLALNLLAAVFPIQKEVRLYSFTIIIFTMILGVFLLLANMLIAYAPETYTTALVYAAYGGIVLLYSFSALRGAIIGQQFIYAHLFHFLLYICAIEIAPVIVLAKWIKDLAGA